MSWPWVVLCLSNALWVALDVAHGAPTWAGMMGAAGFTSCLFIIILKKGGVIT